MSDKLVKNIVLIVFILTAFISCKSNVKVNNNSVVKIGISREPSALLPFKRQGSVEKQINPYIYIQLADFDPVSLKNIPILLEKMPNETKIDTGIYKGTYRYDLIFRKIAKWDNGTSITGMDYLYSAKILLNPMIDMHPAIPSLYKNIVDIVLDEDNPQKLSVYAKSDYLLTKELVTNFEIYPEYFYDSIRVMRQIDLKTLLNSDDVSEKVAQIKGAKELAKKYNSSYFMRENISNSGPYRINKWLSNQYVELVKKENYWGNSLNDITYLQNKPDKIIFKILPDKSTALSELKNNNIDILNNVSANDFLSMQNDSTYSERFNFYNPLTLKYNVVIINNRKPLLKDRNIRLALAHLIDIDFLIKMHGVGKEKRLVSPIHPSKPYYMPFKALEYDIDKAKKLLSLSGWSDSNRDGIIDKNIQGKNTRLHLSITISGNKFSKTLALTLKENAKKAGIEIEIKNRGKKNYRKDKKRFDFDLIVSGVSKALVDYDPYFKWHSDNIGAGGSNLSGFNNEKCDRLIEEIRTEKAQPKKYKYYELFQQLIYYYQPVIFLYVPTNKIISAKNVNILTSVKRPGYFVNTANQK